MSLKKVTEYKGISLENAIYKITGINFNEKEKVDGVKYYYLNLIVTSYTNEDKEYILEQRTYEFETTIDGLTIENGYKILKTLPEFETAIDY